MSKMKERNIFLFRKQPPAQRGLRPGGSLLLQELLTWCPSCRSNLWLRFESVIISEIRNHCPCYNTFALMKLMGHHSFRLCLVTIWDQVQVGTSLVRFHRSGPELSCGAGWGSYQAGVQRIPVSESAALNPNEFPLWNLGHYVKLSSSTEFVNYNRICLQISSIKCNKYFINKECMEDLFHWKQGVSRHRA